MFSCVPPIASGYRGSRKKATLEEHNLLTNQLGTNNTLRNQNNIFGRTTRVATNLRSYFAPLDPNHVYKHPHNDRGHGSHCQQCASTRDHHSHQGSCWAESKATCRFCKQSAQFDTGTKSFWKCTCPTASQLILVIHNESWTTQIWNKQSKLDASAFQISQHEQAAPNQFSQKIGDFMHTQAYRQAPQEKPDNCIQVIMENFNSLGIFTKGTKINSLNKLCQQFNTDILAGCKTQADWHQASEERQFRNVIRSWNGN